MRNFTILVATTYILSALVGTIYAQPTPKDSSQFYDIKGEFNHYDLPQGQLLRRDMNNEDFKKSSFDQEHRGGFPGQHKEHQGNDHRSPEMHKGLNGEHGPNEASRDHESHKPGQEHHFRRDMNNENFKKLLFDQEHRGGFFDKHMEYKKPNGEHGQNGASRDHESRKQDTHKSQDGHGL